MPGNSRNIDSFGQNLLKVYSVKGWYGERKKVCLVVCDQKIVVLELQGIWLNVDILNSASRILQC